MLHVRMDTDFDNGTENNMLRRSLHKDDARRRITEPTVGPLFAEHATDGDEAVEKIREGTIMRHTYDANAASFVG